MGCCIPLYFSFLGGQNSHICLIFVCTCLAVIGLATQFISDSSPSWLVLLILVRKWATILSGQNAVWRSPWVNHKRAQTRAPWGPPEQHGRWVVTLPVSKRGLTAYTQTDKHQHSFILDTQFVCSPWTQRRQSMEVKRSRSRSESCVLCRYRISKWEVRGCKERMNRIASTIGASKVSFCTLWGIPIIACWSFCQECDEA